MFVDFDLAKLPDRMLNLIVTASGSGWLHDALVMEGTRRTSASNEAEATPLILPPMDIAQARRDYLEIGKSLIAVESRQLEVDAVEAAELEHVARLFYQIAVAIRQQATSDAVAN